ncbi:hypothetical protein ACVWZM_005245 [Bradyrhizobium sp. USDA 4501]
MTITAGGAMIEDANLLPRDRALYAKLYASHGDIGVARSCAEFILKKGWHTYSFMRRGSVRIQQTAFITTMIVAYARPFAPGRGNINFPHRLLQYDSQEMAFHKRLLDLRKQEYAHSDASKISVRPLKGSVVTSIVSIRDLYFSPAELKLFLGMTGCLSSRIQERLEEIRLGGS